MGGGNVPFKSQLKYDCTYPGRTTARPATRLEAGVRAGGCACRWRGGCTILSTVQLPKREEKNKIKLWGMRNFGASVIFLAVVQ